MIDELRKMVEERLTEVSGLHGLVITDKDGVPVLQVSAEGAPASTESCMRYQFTSSKSAAEEKYLNLNNLKRTLVHYQDLQILTVVHDQLLLSLIADAEASTGILENFAKRMEGLVSDIAKAVIIT